LDTCREALKRNVDKKFMNPTYPQSDIPIPGEWTLATAYDAKSGPTWLDRGVAFSNVKELLEGIFSDVKKGTRFVVWLGFRVPDDEALELPTATSTPATPVVRDLPAARSTLRKTKVKEEPGISRSNRKIKQEDSDMKSNVRLPY
jgi:hypothetical protein